MAHSSELGFDQLSNTRSSSSTKQATHIGVDKAGKTTIETHVDVTAAKQNFVELEQKLSETSWSEEIDLEKGERSSFNLREYLNTAQDANSAAGIRHKHVGVTWSDLQVSVPNHQSKVYVGNLFSTVTRSLLFPLTWALDAVISSPASTDSRPILHKNSGLLKPGEMCLVLGLPGSGCSTFLKAITNQRGGSSSVVGEVQYAGISHKEMARLYPGEVIYNGEDDIHIPTLTVDQTIDFVLSTKTPGKRLPGVSGKDFNKEVKDTLLQMLAIDHTRDTLVGDPFIRGVSGGEKKRLSVIETMATRAHVVAYDNSTRGLDSSTALDFVKALRVTTDVLGQTTFVSLYQAAESLYEIFDRVLLIDEGRVIYFGPTSQARSYFTSLGFQAHPRQTTPDFLTACTDPKEHRVSQTVEHKEVPISSEALQAAFQDSHIFQEMENIRQEYHKKVQVELSDQAEFRTAVEESKRGASRLSPYNIGFGGQVKVLLVRQMRLQAQDRFTLIASFCISTVCALVLGGAFFNLPTNTFGGYTRGSIIFMALLTTCLDAIGEMPAQMLGRPVFAKQFGYVLYRPAALSVANSLADIPFSAIRVLVSNVIVYFMSGLNRTASGFWTFHILIYLSYLTLQGAFRTVGALCQSFDVAFRIAVFLSPHIISYGGYTIPYDSIKPWVAWIFYLNPLSYAFSGLLANEFHHLDMVCDGDYVVPRNGDQVSKYPSFLGDNQTCAFFGSKPGNTFVQGDEYLKAAFNIDSRDLWRRNFLVLLGMFLFFQVAQALALEKTSNQAGTSPQVFARPKKNNGTVNALPVVTLLAESGSFVEKNKSKPNFMWKNVHYTVPLPSGESRTLLNGVTGYLKPGSLTALVGASGAGKTTALDVFAQRKTVGVVTGEIRLGGDLLSASFGREVAYAEQMDIHEPTSTVREALLFSAYLRQSYTSDDMDKNNYVESIMELLELQDLADCLVMSLGVEGRKRLTVGVELAAKPNTLLFLDEPTTGMDAQSALKIVRFLRKLTSSGLAILCTIHQPSVLLFQEFDRLLLLEEGGQTVYFGPIGPDSHCVRSYLAGNGAVCDERTNPVEFALRAIGVGNARSLGQQPWKDYWISSNENQTLNAEIAELEACSANEQPVLEKSRFGTPFWFQLMTVSKRASIGLWRSPDYLWTRMFLHIALSLILSLAYFQLDHSIRSIQFRTFAIFGVTIIPGLICSHILPMFFANRMVFIREFSSKMYSPAVFALSQLIAELPYSCVCAVLYWVLMYYPQGLGKGSSGPVHGAGYFFALIWVVVIFGTTLGQAIGALVSSMRVALLFSSPITLILTTFAGVTIPYPNLPSFWRTWMYELNPYTRIMAGLLATELTGLEIICNEDEFVSFNPPSGQTCEAWADSFIQKFGGYLQNPTATTACQYCQYKVGDEYYARLNIMYGNRGRDLGILATFIIFNIVVTVLASTYLRHNRR